MKKLILISSAAFALGLATQGFATQHKAGQNTEKPGVQANQWEDWNEFNPKEKQVIKANKRAFKHAQQNTSPGQSEGFAPKQRHTVRNSSAPNWKNLTPEQRERIKALRAKWKNHTPKERKAFQESFKKDMQQQRQLHRQDVKVRKQKTKDIRSDARQDLQEENRENLQARRSDARQNELRKNAHRHHILKNNDARSRGSLRRASAHHRAHR